MRISDDSRDLSLLQTVSPDTSVIVNEFPVHGSESMVAEIGINVAAKFRVVSEG